MKRAISKASTQVNDNLASPPPTSGDLVPTKRWQAMWQMKTNYNHMKIMCFMNYKITGFVWVFLLIHQWVNAQMYEDTWQTERTFKTTATFVVSVNNKYGSVVVSTWDKDSIRISVTRRVSEKSKERLKRMVESIDIRFREGNGQVWAETVVGSKHTTFIQDVKEAGNFASATPRTRIDYKIMVPSYVNIEVTNKYGDVVLPSFSGNAKIDLSNGNLQARDFKGYTEMNLAFGSAEIRSIKQGRVFLNFMNFVCDASDKLTLEGRSSEIRIKEAGQLKIDSRRDRLSLGQVKELEATTYFSSLNCLNLKEFVRLNLTYGRLEQLTMARDFKGCEIVSQTCDVNLRLMTPVAYSALIQSGKTLNLPVGLKPESIDYKSLIHSEPMRFNYLKRMPADKIKVNISDGELKIEHQ